ncbi:NAD-dependent epimerase/dehydratase family protein [Desulfobacterota bacterium M19]
MTAKEAPLKHSSSPRAPQTSSLEPRSSILVTGATGFLGSHLAHGLLEAGYRVLAFRRKTSDLWRLTDIAEQIEWYDTTDLELPFKKHKKIDHVIHTATIYGRNSEKGSQLVETNLLFPLKLYEIASAFNTDTFFNTDTVLPKYLNGYSLSKKQLCEWLRMLADSTKVVNVRLEHIYGPKDDSSKFVTSIISQCLSSMPELKLTKGEQKRDFIFIDDVVAGYLCLLDNISRLQKTFVDVGMGSGDSISIKDLVECVVECTGSETKPLFGTIPYRENEIMDSNADIQLLTELGWQSQISLVEGVRETIKSVKKELK